MMWMSGLSLGELDDVDVRTMVHRMLSALGDFFNSETLIDQLKQNSDSSSDPLLQI